MTDLALGIDIGTSGVRIAATTRDGQMVAMAAAAMASPERTDGHVRQDPSVWWTAVEEAFLGLRQSIDLARIGALAVDGTSGTILALDAAGHPCGPASLYNDICNAETVAQIAAHAPEASAARGATSALGRALELQRLYPSAVRFVHQADWIAGRIIGRCDTTDENNALKTGYDPVSRTWPAWIEAAGLALAKLPRVVPAGAPIAPASAGATLGLSPDTLVVAGTTDGCAAFLATGADQPGDAVTSLGTTLVLKLLCDAPIFAPAYGIYSHRIGDTWLAGGASNSGGAALLKFFSSEQMAALEDEIRPQEPTGLDYYPLPAPGERFPINDPGLAPRTDPRPADDARFLQGLFEGIAGVEKLGYDRLAELGGPALRAVYSVGGGARNEAWSAIRTNTLGVSLREPENADAACGAARLAWRGLEAR